MACIPTTTYNDFTGGGSTTQFTFTFEYIDATDVKVRTGDEPPYTDVPVSEYYIDPANPQTITFVSAPVGPFRVYRCTSDNDLDATFQAGSAVRAGDLNDNFKQLLFLNQENRSTENSNFGVTQNQLDQLETDLTTEINRVETDLTTEINRVETDLTTEINRVETDLTTEINRVETDLTTEINRVETDLTTEINSVETDLTAEINSVETDLTADINSVDADLTALETQVNNNSTNVQNELDTKIDTVNASSPLVAVKTGTDLALSIPNATSSADGAMSSQDKAKLDGLNFGSSSVPIPDLQLVTTSGSTTTNSITAGGFNTAGTVAAQAGSFVGKVTSDSTVSSDPANTLVTKAYVDAQGNSSNIVNDTTPQLGGDLDVNGNDITSASNGDVVINPNGTGNIVLDGDVGIGVQDPLTKLHIAGTTLCDVADYASNQDAAYLIAGTDGWTGATTNWNTFGFQHKLKTNSGGVPRITVDTKNGEALCVLDSKNIGIGVTAPAAKLEIGRLGADWTGAAPIAGSALFVHNGNNSASSPAYIQVSAGNASFAGIFFGDDAGSSRGGILYDNSDDSLQFNTSGAGRLNINSSGNVGIGTDNPIRPLHIEKSSGDVEILLKTTSADSCNVLFGDEGNNAAGKITYDHPSNSFRFHAAGSERVRVAANGRLGIGTDSPAATLDLNGNYTSNVTAVSALDIDCSTGNYFTKTINANSTFTFSNVPSSRAYSFTLELTHTSGTVTWPTSVKFNSDTAPTLTAGKTHLFMFVTDDGGTRFRAAALVDYVN